MNSSASRQVSMDIGYMAGPVNIQLAHHDANDATGAKLARSTMIGGNLDFGLVRGWVAAARQLAAGYYHWLSKRTNLYLVCSLLRNGSAANYQTTLPGGSRRVVAAGIRHQF